jgi:hypothetical protein
VLDFLGKFAEVKGQFGYIRDQKRGRTTRLIEYKAAAPRAVVGNGMEAEQA